MTWPVIEPEPYPQPEDDEDLDDDADDINDIGVYWYFRPDDDDCRMSTLAYNHC